MYKKQGRALWALRKGLLSRETYVGRASPAR